MENFGGALQPPIFFNTILMIFMFGGKIAPKLERFSLRGGV